MVTETISEWQPNWAVPPGEILLEALQERSMSQSELARRMNRPVKTINEIVNAKAAITPETAIQLERVLGISARFWNALEVAYREHLAREQAVEELKEQASWVDRFPIRDLVWKGLLSATKNKAETLSELLVFFRVSSPQAWERHWLQPGASYRASPAFVASPEAVATWLRWGEIEASKIACQPFNARAFQAVLKDIRQLTNRRPISVMIEQVRTMCAAVGVAIVLTPELEGTHLSGAARWLSPTNALIQLSLRHVTDDHFWFSFFHEAGHLLAAGKRRDFVDGVIEQKETADDDERLADDFARDLLIPPVEYTDFVNAGIFDATAIRAFAERIEIAPGIVVGRLQYDGLLRRSQLNDLKKSLKWA
ncbi:MAG: HigA family addiction module antitoxin [Actinomycetota bacterium]|nr:HigA family addiction module antitoxin [Actinomycetota bacterium]